jgi:hypothetical protein
MAIEHGRIRGWRVTGRYLQRGSGLLSWNLVPFDEDFGGEFSDIVNTPLSFSYRITAGPETWESLHGSCVAAGALQGRTLVYLPAAQQARPSSVSGSINTLSGGLPIVGISLSVKESPATIQTPPCGPVPWVFFKFPDPLQPNPYAPSSRTGSAGSLRWTSSAYGRRGWAGFA